MWLHSGGSQPARNASSSSRPTSISVSYSSLSSLLAEPAPGVMNVVQRSGHRRGLGRGRAHPRRPQMLPLPPPPPPAQRQRGEAQGRCLLVRRWQLAGRCLLARRALAKRCLPLRRLPPTGRVVARVRRGCGLLWSGKSRAARPGRCPRCGLPSEQLVGITAGAVARQGRRWCRQQLGRARRWGRRLGQGLWIIQRSFFGGGEGLSRQRTPPPVVNAAHHQSANDDCEGMAQGGWKGARGSAAGNGMPPAATPRTDSTHDASHNAGNHASRAGAAAAAAAAATSASASA